MKNYEEMSDFEINKLVTEQVAWTEPGCTAVTFENHCFWANATGMRAYPIEDYCNDVSAAWPIIAEHGISLNKFCKADFNWTVDVEHPNPTAYYNTIEVTHKEPLRAAMICFLKMKDAETEVNV